MTRVTARAAVLIAVLVWSTGVSAQPRPMGFVEALSLPVIQDPQLSPDGRQVVFAMETADWKANRRISHLYRINVDGTDQVQLTFGERGETSPRWSPDGAQLAFLARRDGDEHNQIYLLHAGGGEARRLTTLASAPSSIAWAPDGTRLFLVAPDAKTPEEREKDRLQDDVYAFEETNFKQRHLWTVDLAGATTRVTEGAFSVGQFAISPDGSRLVMSRAPSPLLEFSHLAELWVTDARGGDARQLTSGNRVSEGSLSISPDNGRVLFRAGANEALDGYHNGKVFVLPLAGGTARLATPADATYDVSDAEWSKDGSTIFFVASLGVHDEVFSLDVAVAARDRAHERRAQPRGLRLPARRGPVRLHPQHRRAPRRGARRDARGPRAAARDARLRGSGVALPAGEAGTLHLEGARRADGRGPALLPGRVSRRPALPAHRGHPRRTGIVGQVRIQPRRAGLRRQGVCGAEAELPRQHGVWGRVPSRDVEGILQAVAPRRHDRHRRRDCEGPGGSREAREDGLERGRSHDEQDDHLHRSLQGGEQRGRRGELDLDVRTDRTIASSGRPGSAARRGRPTRRSMCTGITHR